MTELISSRRDRGQRVIDFRSDDVASVSPEIIVATLEANTDTAAPYGGICCHAAAHIHTSEAGATELLTGGAKLLPLEGDGFRLQSPALAGAVTAAGFGITNRSQPAAVSVTQATDFGTVYRLDELTTIAEVARCYRLKNHMDGARFANALATLGCPPTAITWRVGVDVLSFSCTKSGGLNADAIVVFNQDLAKDLSFRIRRSGHTWSKMRFPAAQLLAYVRNDLYLRSAQRDNELAARLAANIEGVPEVSLVAPVEATEVFPNLPESGIDHLITCGIQFLGRGPRMIPPVCRFDGADEDVDEFAMALRASE